MNIAVYDPNVTTKVVIDITARKIASAEAGKAALAAVTGDERTQAIIDAEAEVDAELAALVALDNHEAITVHIKTLTNATRLELATKMADCEWSGSGFDELMTLTAAQITEIEGQTEIVDQMDGGMAEFLMRIVDPDIQRGLVKAVSDHCTMPVDEAKN